MNRRDAIRCIALSAVGIIFPVRILTPDRYTKPFHFIGLGDAGTTLLRGFYDNGLRGRFTSINDTRQHDLPEKIEFIQYIAPSPSHVIAGHRIYELSDLKKERGIPGGIQALAAEDVFFVILSGLGRYTGSYLSVQLSGLLYKANKDHMVVTTLPFSFEGRPSLQPSLRSHTLVFLPTTPIRFSDKP